MKIQRLLAAALLALLMPTVAQAQTMKVGINVNPANFQFVLPFEKSGTYDPANDLATPVPLGSPRWPNAATAPNCAISGPQSVGFTIDPNTCNLSLSYDYKSLDAGALNQWGKLRNFNVTADKAGGGTLTGTIQVTFDTSSFLARGNPVAGLDTIIGVTDKSPYKTLGPGNMPAGWTYATTAVSAMSSTSKSPSAYIYPTIDNPAPLIHYDLTGLNVCGAFGCGAVGCQATNPYGVHKGVVIRQSKFGPTPTMLVPGQPTYIQFYCGQMNDVIVENNNFDLQGDVYRFGSTGITANIPQFNNNVITGCSGDCLTFTINGTNNYIRTAATANRVWDPTGNPMPASVYPDQLGWVHADGYQSISPAGPISLTYSYIDDRASDFDYSQVTARTPAGTIACSGTTCTGVGTSWVTGADKDRISATDSIVPGHLAFHYQVASVQDDTHLTLQTSLSLSARSGYKVGPTMWALAQVSYPFYPQGESGASSQFSVTSYRNVLRGGSNIINGPANSIGLVTYDSNVMGDWAQQPVKNSPPTFNVQKNVQFSDLKTAVGTTTSPTLSPPNPSLGTVTATTAVFSLADQGGGTVYQYRYKTNATGAPWSAWAPATPGNNTVSGLTASTTYFIEVQALNGLIPDGSEYLQNTQSIIRATTPAS